MYIILFYIVALNELHSVHLASLRFNSNRMSDKAPNGSSMKPKLTCGPIQFPDFSCEDSTTPKSKTTLVELPTGLMEEKSTWKPEEELFEELSPWRPLETIYDAQTPKHEKLSNEQKVSKSLPIVHPLATSKTVQNKTNSIVNFKTVTSKKLYRKEIQKLKNPLSSGIKSQDNVLRGVSSSSSRRVVTRSSIIRNLQALNLRQRLMHTMSTYPPFPGGTTPTRQPEPTEILMCGIAKCLSMNWTDSGENTLRKATKKVKLPVDDSQDVFSDPQGLIIDS